MCSICYIFEAQALTRRFHYRFHHHHHCHHHHYHITIIIMLLFHMIPLNPSNKTPGHYIVLHILQMSNLKFRAAGLYAHEHSASK